mmetsp:Transcript_25626/g.33552  ORF Transcript_25626/g.33552 Transcript_25626/m.33552 type:complete len:419 (-) Transcript_25626:257-1513(-)
MLTNLPTISFKDKHTFQEKISHQTYTVAKSRFEGSKYKEDQKARQSNEGGSSRFNVTFFNGRRDDSHDMFARDAANMRRFREKVGDQKPPLPGAKERALTARLAKKKVVEEGPMHRPKPLVGGEDALPAPSQGRENSMFAKVCESYDMPGLEMRKSHLLKRATGSKVPIKTMKDLDASGKGSEDGVVSYHSPLVNKKTKKKGVTSLTPIASGRSSAASYFEEVAPGKDPRLLDPINPETRMQRTDAAVTPAPGRYDTVTRHTNTKWSNKSFSFKVAQQQNDFREPFEASPKLYETRKDRITMPDGRRFNTYFRKKDRFQHVGDGSKMPVLHTDEHEIKRKIRDKYDPKYYGHLDTYAADLKKAQKNESHNDHYYPEVRGNPQNGKPLQTSRVPSERHEVASLNDWHKQTLRRLQSNHV